MLNHGYPIIIGRRLAGSGASGAVRFFAAEVRWRAGEPDRHGRSEGARCAAADAEGLGRASAGPVDRIRKKNEDCCFNAFLAHLVFSAKYCSTSSLLCNTHTFQRVLKQAHARTSKRAHATVCRSGGSQCTTVFAIKT